jgi:hypothetical protein
MTNEIKTAFDDAALARDEAGYFGTPADCIRGLTEENKMLRQILSVIRYEAKNPPDADRMARILGFANKALGF